ncbi:hypothetical protein LCGC14_0487220 [marine sediment metagenome]|uniref:Uncharacterized protein n=1 Tax=marine sediment metagenome TaxID=412755 RepID=A0A0F9VGH8_9ZZZZ
MDSTKKFKSEGVVFGNCWGGGGCGYAAEQLQANTLQGLIDLAEAGIVDGSLDSGMGFESLYAAGLHITCIETRIIDGKTFEHKTTEFHEIGQELTMDEQNSCYQ